MDPETHQALADAFFAARAEEEAEEREMKDDE